MNERKWYQSVRVRSLAKRMYNERTNERKFMCSFNVLYAKRCVHKLRKKTKKKSKRTENISLSIFWCVHPKRPSYIVWKCVREREILQFVLIISMDSTISYSTFHAVDVYNDGAAVFVDRMSAVHWNFACQKVIFKIQNMWAWSNEKKLLSCTIECNVS